MNDSVSSTKLDIKTDNVYTNDGTNPHLRTSSTTTATNSSIINPPRTPTDLRHYHTQMIRTPSVENSKSMTIIVQNPFEDPVRHIDDPSTDSSRYLLHSPSPSKPHSISNVQSPRTLSRTPTPGTPHQITDDVSMPSPSMTSNLQRHPSQQIRPQQQQQPTNNGTQRNIVPQQQQQQQQQLPPPPNQSVQNHVRFNQDLLHNYGINVPMARQTSQTGSNEPPQSPSNPSSVTSLIPLPVPLSNNLGVNMHHINQPSITPTILGGFPMHQSNSQVAGTNTAYISQQQANISNKMDVPHTISPHGSHHPHHAPQGIYVNTRPMMTSPVMTVTGIGKVRPPLQQQQPPPSPLSTQQQQQQQQQLIRPGMPTNGTPVGPSTVVLRYPHQMMQTPQQVQQQQQQQQHGYQMMKPRMMPPNAYGPRPTGGPSPQIIMQQQPQLNYDSNALYRTAPMQQQQPPPPIQIQQPQQQSLQPIQSNPHINENLINQQKHSHPQTMQQQQQQQVLHLPPGMLSTDDNILKSLLQINPQANSEEIANAVAIKSRPTNAITNGLSTDNPTDHYDNSSHNYPNNNNNHHHQLYNPNQPPSSAPSVSIPPTPQLLPNFKIPKSRKKRKPNEPNPSFDDEVPAKSRKRKKKGTEEAEKFVEHSLQQLRDLPMLTPLEPLIDINNEFSLTVPLNLSEKKSSFQGDFGHVFIENMSDYYRPSRHAPPPPKKPLALLLANNNSQSTLERHYRICSTLLEHPPNVPSPPLAINTTEKLTNLLVKESMNEIRDDESIVSTSTLADDDDNQTDTYRLLKTLTSNQDSRPLSPIFDSSTIKNSELATLPLKEIKQEVNDTDGPLVDGTDKISVTLTLTTEAANNVQSVIAAVADLLKIAYPSTFDVHQTLNNTYSSSIDGTNCQCSTPLTNTSSQFPFSSSSSSNPLNSTISRASSLYKTGRETSVSIQSLIEMQPKYCRHCTQRLLNENVYKKRLNELPSSIRELTPNSEPFVYFCNEQCFNSCVSTTHQQTLTINTSISSNSPTIKNESMDTTSPPCTPNDLLGSPNGRPRRSSLKRRQDSLSKSNGDKRWKDIRWKRWDPSLTLKTIIRPSNNNEIEQLLSEMKIPLTENSKEDKRVCAFCRGTGDAATNGPGRLLNLDVGQWCHLNCALWSTEVYETVSGALMCVEQAFKRSTTTECASCRDRGASLTCFFQRCPNAYHFPCAVTSGCVFYKNKTIMCPMHASRTTAVDQILDDKSVFRKVWINRDEVKQIQNSMAEEHDEVTYILRIGGLVLHNIGQLLPHQIQSGIFHNRNFIYPVGYSITRFYWSMRHPNRRCAYHCSIINVDNKPMFRIRIQENPNEPYEEILESSAKTAWHKIVDEIDSIRRKHRLVKMFSVFVSGEDLYGLTVRIQKKKRIFRLAFRVFRSRISFVWLNHCQALKCYRIMHLNMADCNC